MNKIVLLPLDERPCNYIFPTKIFENENINIIKPSLDILGNKKRPGDIKKISKFLIDETKDADGLVISIDTLLYGGIVPSRLHHHSKEELLKRLSIIKTLKENNPKLKIYAFHLIMRSPQNSSNDEEPDYYAKYGKEIFLKGYLSHKKELSILSEDESLKLKSLEIDNISLKDFLDRRYLNTHMVLETLKLLKNNLIDFLIIPQDDAAEYGWTAKDQEVVRKQIERNNLQLKSYMYPGADEVGMVLLSRMILSMNKKKPLIYIHYPSITSGHLIPRYEDRMLDTTVKYQVIAAGAIVASSILEADLVLFVNAPSANMIDVRVKNEKNREYSIQRNLVEFITQINYVVNDLNKPAMIADVAYSNGGDLELVMMLEDEDLLMNVASYAGWNTSSNSIGTAIPHGISYWLNGDSKRLKSFLASRYIEDCGYCSLVRGNVVSNDLPNLGYDYFNTGHERGKVSSIVKKKLNIFINEKLPSLDGKVIFKDVYMPWKRMFEVGLEIEYDSDNNT